MRNVWSDIAARQRDTEAFEQRLELRLHAVAMVITSVVLAMRLVAGTRDLSSEPSAAEQPSSAAVASPPLGL